MDWGTVWTALCTTIMKSIAYTLPTTSFTEEKKTNKKSPDSTLQSSATAMWPDHVIPSWHPSQPLRFQGNGLEYLYNVQNTNHIRDILDYGHRRSISRNFITLAIEDIKLEAGIEGPLFQYRRSIPYLNITNSWVYNTWLFYQEHDIDFDEKCCNLEKKCANDKFFMEAFLKHGYSAADPKVLNRCRLYIRAIVLSDLSSRDGYILQDGIFHGLRRLNQDSYIWPAQGRPPLWE